MSYVVAFVLFTTYNWVTSACSITCSSLPSVKLSWVDALASNQ